MADTQSFLLLPSSTGQTLYVIWLLIVIDFITMEEFSVILSSPEMGSFSLIISTLKIFEVSVIFHARFHVHMKRL